MKITDYKALSKRTLSKDAGCYLSTLDGNLQKKGIKEQQERYRAMIQFALGNQDVKYTNSITNAQNFQILTKVNSMLTREDIHKAFSKGKKAKETMRKCVTREAVDKMEKTEQALERILSPEVSVGE